MLARESPGGVAVTRHVHRGKSSVHLLSPHVCGGAFEAEWYKSPQFAHANSRPWLPAFDPPGRASTDLYSVLHSQRSFDARSSVPFSRRAEPVRTSDLARGARTRRSSGTVARSRPAVSKKTISLLDVLRSGRRRSRQHQ